MYLVHCGSYLGKYKSGRDLVTEIAYTAIVAEIYDILLGMNLDRVYEE